MREIAVRIKQKAPSKYSILRNMSCIDPLIIAMNQDSCVSKLKKVQWILVSNGKVKSNKSDSILQQYSDVFMSAVLPNKDTFTQFSPFDAEKRLD